MRKENLKFNAELQFETIKLENVPCEIVFPKTQDEKVVLEAQLIANEFLPSEIPFIFSLRATFSNAQGSLLKISAEKVYNLGIKTSYVATNQEYSILRAEPVNLKIQEFIQSSEDQKNPKNFYFWLTQSIQLAPFYSTELHYNGNISVKTYRNKEFEIVKGLKFSFINYYLHYNDPKRKNKRISEPVLAAEFVGFTEHELGENIFSEIEIFLKMVSFSERTKIVCYGYKGILENEIVDFYRGDIFVPEEDFNHSNNEVLIDVQDFEEFTLKSLNAGRNCPFREHLFDAIGKAAYREYSSLESEYLSYYSALENLLNGYRDTHNLHYILENDDYKKFSKELKSFIKKHDLFRDDNDTERELRTKKRQWVYEKISELNRISFGTAFKEFCEFYQIDLRDLWSLRGSTSLTEIRNRLIHGGRFEKAEYEALVCAKTHLKWTLERCILRVLDWDIEKSNVRPLFLKHYVSYNEWEQKRSLLSHIS
ncbi:hypothetical protein NIES2101_36895 [Calothrix sp. HK-06]|nr:hypothetical protein NIES2101_36895 [Calothrix sp. HK-06]